MLKIVLYSTVIMLLTACITYPQNDIGPDTKFGVTGSHGMTPEEKAAPKNIQQTGRVIPQYLIDQLSKAQEDGNIEEENRIMNILMAKYYDKKCFSNSEPKIIETNGKHGQINQPSYDPDWMSNDIIIYDGININKPITPRTFDIKMGPDGRIYVVYCQNYNQSSSTCAMTYSTNGGLTWNFQCYCLKSNIHFTGISMLVERTHPTIEDSIRVTAFLTGASNYNNDDAKLFVISHNPYSCTLVKKIIDQPTTGREFNFPTAFSNGEFNTSSTDIGCIVGEYDNEGTTLHTLRYYYMSNWSWNFTAVRFSTGYNDFYPSAAYKDVLGNDSVFIAVERRMGSNKQIRIIKTTFVPSSSFSTTYLTSTYYYEKPVLNIVQKKWACDKMIITCTRSYTARYHYSINGGATWNTDFYLDNRPNPSNTTLYTGVSTDTNTSGNNYCVAIYSDQDSINVRKGILGSLGTTLYKRNSIVASENAFPVCFLYRSGSNYSSAFSYWGDGPDSISTKLYIDGQHLPFTITHSYMPAYLYYKFYPIGLDSIGNHAIPGVGSSWAQVHGLSVVSNGQFDNALKGNGGSSSTNYLNTGWATNIGTSSWTISMWLNNLPSTTSQNYLFGDHTAGSFGCFYSGAAGVHGVMLNLSGVRGSDITVPGVGPGPTVLTFVYDSVASVVHAYKNGVLSNSQPQSSPLNINGTGPFKVGGYGSSASMPAGSLLDEFRFYNEALDSTEVARTWNQTLPIITNVKPGLNNTPEEYTLSQNYPNPFNPITKIKYTLPTSGLATLKVYDILGREVATLVDEVTNSGIYFVDFDGSGFSSGVYFYRIEAGDFIDVKKMILIK